MIAVCQALWRRL